MTGPRSRELSGARIFQVRWCTDFPPGACPRPWSEPGLEPAEAHDVHEFVGQDLAQQGKFEVAPAGQRLQDVMVLEGHPVEVEGLGFELPPRVATAVFGHDGQGMGGDFLIAQVGQGGNVIPGGEPVAGW